MILDPALRARLMVAFALGDASEVAAVLAELGLDEQEQRKTLQDLAEIVELEMALAPSDPIATFKEQLAELRKEKDHG